MIKYPNTNSKHAFVIATSGDTAVEYLMRNSKDAWSTEKILTVVAATILVVYSIKLTKEYIDEINEEPDAEEEAAKAQEDSDDEWAEALAEAEAEAGLVPTSRPKKKDADDKQAEEEKERSQTLFVIAFVGSLDDLTLFVPMLVGKGFDMVQLISGGFVAAFLIVNSARFFAAPSLFSLLAPSTFAEALAANLDFFLAAFVASVATVTSCFSLALNACFICPSASCFVLPFRFCFMLTNGGLTFAALLLAARSCAVGVGCAMWPCGAALRATTLGGTGRFFFISSRRTRICSVSSAVPVFARAAFCLAI